MSELFGNHIVGFPTRRTIFGSVDYIWFCVVVICTSHVSYDLVIVKVLYILRHQVFVRVLNEMLRIVMAKLGIMCNKT